MAATQLSDSDILSRCNFLATSTLPYFDQLNEAIRLLLLTGARICEIFEIDRWYLDTGDTYYFQPQKGNNVRSVVLDSTFASFKAAIDGQYAPFLGCTQYQLTNIFDKIKTWERFTTEGHKVTFYIFRYNYVKQRVLNGDTASQIASAMGYTSTSTVTSYIEAVIYEHLYEPPSGWDYQGVSYFTHISGYQVNQLSSSAIISLFETLVKSDGDNLFKFYVFVDNYNVGFPYYLSDVNFNRITTYTGWVLFYALFVDGRPTGLVLQQSTYWHLLGYYFYKGVCLESYPSINTEVPYYSAVPSVVIGTQVWMSVNLDVDDDLGGIYAPNGNEDNVNDYGRLYTWDAASRIAANVAGWRLPTLADLSTLYTYTGGSSSLGGKLKETGTSHWQTPNTSASDIYDFTARAAGRRSYLGTYNYFNQYAIFWLEDESSPGYYSAFRAFYNSASVTQVYNSKLYAHSVRLIKDS